MVSIESDIEHQDRFNFNVPFDCIKMAFGTANDLLPNLEIFDVAPVICWLDYYDRLTASILGDVKTVLKRSKLGSAFLVTLNAAGISKPDEISKFLQNLPESSRTAENRRKLGSREGLRAFMLDEIESVIASTLSDLNPSNETEMIAHRIMQISYRDAAEMVTYGWLLISAEQKAELERPTAAHVGATIQNGDAMLRVCIG